MSRYGRLLRISSAGEKPCPITVQKPKPVERPVITLGSPVSIARSDHQGITNEDYGLFLQSCFQCRKQFGKKDDLFMYGEKMITSEEKESLPQHPQEFQE